MYLLAAARVDSKPYKAAFIAASTARTSVASGIDAGIKRPDFSKRAISVVSGRWIEDPNRQNMPQGRRPLSFSLLAYSRLPGGEAQRD